MPSITLNRLSVNCLAPSRKPGTYLYDRSQLFSESVEGDISIPLVIDTEFQSHLQDWTVAGQQPRFGLTTQIRGIHTQAPGRIFEHLGVDMNRHPVVAFGFHPVDYLQAVGYKATLERVQDMPEDLPKAEFVLYAFFALAEAMMIVDGDYKADFKTLMQAQTEGKGAKQGFDMTRRLMAKSPGKKGAATDFVSLPWVLTLEGIRYAVRLCWVDAGAVHGAASYKDFCEAAGVELAAKDLLSQEDKENMAKTYQEKPDDFDAYALGDLEVYEALEKNADNFKRIYQALGVEDLWQAPKLTIGSTVKDLFLAVLQRRLGVSDPKEVQDLKRRFLEPASAGCLRQDPTSTKALLSKVEGGRCRNNRPLDISKHSLIVDLDISGCYGEGQRNQLYFIGNPRVVAYPAGSKANDYYSLRDFLKAWGKVLVSGGWFARVSTEAPLKHSQDFLASWFVNGKAGEDLLAKYAAKASGDTEDQGDDLTFNEEDGNLKVFNHEILNGTITSDFVDWLDNVCSAQQRNELLDLLKVKAAMYYDQTEEVKTWEDLKTAYATHKGKNRVTRKRNGNLLSEDGECHAWLGINIGDLLIDDLLGNRKLYQKKTPLNSLYKLCVNTLYGDMTSKFFQSANVVVGNNITARARALAWYMEKGLYGFQTITDGCAFEVNRVVFPKEDRRVTAESLVNLYRAVETGNANLRLRPLGNYDKIEANWTEGKLSVTLTKDETKTVLDGDQAMSWVNQASMQHLQGLFPNVTVLHGDSTELRSEKGSDGSAIKTYLPRKGQFSFEAKDWYSSGRFHGTSNYELEKPGYSNLKFRAYETKKAHQSVDDSEIGITDRYGCKNNPAKDLMAQLRSPKTVARQMTFVKDAILKVSDYKNRLATWEDLGLLPGDSFYKPGLLREFSLSQFTFQSLAQYNAWDKAIFRAKEDYGQSLEMYFLNDDGTLNYEEMLKTVDRMISDGVDKPFHVLSKSRHDWKTLGHPSKETYGRVKELLRDS